MFMHFAFNQLNDHHNKIVKIFDRYEDISIFLNSNDFSGESDDESLFLLNSTYLSFILDIVPKHFTITTNNNIPHKFNAELLKDTSTVISNLLNNSPDILEYHINIDDETDTLGKFEQIYQGKPVSFENYEIFTVNNILTILGIEKSPYELKDYRYFNPESTFGFYSDSFVSYLKNEAPQTFTIITRKNEYKCNAFGICSSKILLDLVQKDPFVNEYRYDFDDEFDEFQLISDLLNFKTITITNSNMYKLRDILNDLQITVLIEKVDKFIENAEELSLIINNQQSIVDLNEELFDWLYHIKERNVENVKNLIANSSWIKTDEKVQEFVAFILQVVSTDSTIQTYIVNLIIELEKEVENLNYLRVFLIQKLNKLLGINLNICGFVYKLYQTKIISKEELLCMMKNGLKIQNRSNKYNWNKNETRISNIVNWFYPEILENGEIKTQIGIEKIDVLANILVNRYKYKNNISGYLKMRDKGEPDDELTIALRYDDIDTFKKIIIQKGLLNPDSIDNISHVKIPYNLYERYILNGLTSYIDYACAYGSVKCFKYLLLNHVKVDISSFSAAVFGGNIEIIKTVNQTLQQSQIKPLNHHYYYTNAIIPSIMKHQNDVFDWLFLEKYLNQNIENSTMEEIILCAAENGNAHVFIELIDNGFNFVSIAYKLFAEIAKNGFYLMTKLFFSILQKSKVEKNDTLNFSFSTHFGNKSIFKESFNNMNYEYQLIEALKTAIHFKYMNIIEYFFNKLINEKFKDLREIAFGCINTSISKKSDELFNYFVKQIKKLNPTFFVDFNKFDVLLTRACTKRNKQIVKTIIDMVFEFNHECEDFTSSFYYALLTNDIEICKNFIEKKLFVNYEKLSHQIITLSQIDKEIFSFIVENARNDKYLFLNRNYLEQAIKNKNVGLFEYLLNSKIESKFSLFLAISADDVDVVNAVLKYNCKPSFINRVTEKGTALCSAVEKKNLSIVKRLLSVPGIDPGLYDKNKQTPLLLAINNIEILNEILNFYEKESNIKNVWQFNEAFKILLRILTGDFDLQNHNDVLTPYFDENVKDHDFIPVLIRILNFKEIDPNIIISNFTLLLYACTRNRVDIVNVLLHNQKTDVNLYLQNNGNTPLMVSILNDNFEITKMLINDPRTDLNAKNFIDDTALTLAVNKKLENIVDLLIHNERFDQEESNINKAFQISSGDISCLLSSFKSIDVNQQYNKIEGMSIISNSLSFDHHSSKDEQSIKFLYTTSLLESVEENDIGKVDVIINHPSFDKDKSRFIQSIFTAVEKGHFSMFKRLIKFNDVDVNIHDSDRNSLFNFAVKKKRIEIVDYILDCQSFKPTKSNIFDAFTYYIKNVTNMSVRMMEKLYNHDKEKAINFDELLPTGESFFTLIASQKFIDCDYINVNSSQVGEIASFLIDHGVDPDMPDKKGFYPLEYAILLESSDFVRVILNSNKINLNQIIEMKDVKDRVYINLFDGCLKDSKAVKKTYLHIAARSRVIDILKLFVEINAIDINSFDEFGETPLFDAIRFNRLGNIEYLTSLQTVDFKCCNFEGDDVLKLSMKLMDKKPDFEIQNRDDYVKALIFILKRDQDYLDYEYLD